MIAGILLFLPLTAVLLIVELRLDSATRGSPVQGWLAEHLYLPLLRSAALLIFIFVAHPELFGIPEAPSLGALLADGHYRFDQLINVLLLIALLLPMVPLLDRVSGLTLALQGMCAVALVASWMASERGVPIALAPDIWLVVRISAVLLAARIAGELLAREFLVTRRNRELILEALRMLAQLPAVVLYAHFLGAQL
ncbi:MAG: hypothetical protein HKN59_00860 [Gammaproteobacteria bacterium]|nr:hypothetical protein [Gammaproteobacteria bacterium]